MLHQLNYRVLPSIEDVESGCDNREHVPSSLAQASTSRGVVEVETVPTPVAQQCSRGSRREVSLKLKSTVLTPSFVASSLCDVAELYLKAATVHSGRRRAGVLRTAQLVHRFIAFTKLSLGLTDDDCEWAAAFNLDSVDDYISSLRTAFRPVTVRNHGIEVLRFLRDAGSYAELVRAMPAGLRAGRLKAVEHWANVVKGLEKRYRTSQRELILSGSFEAVKMLPIREYLDDKEVRAKVDAALQNLDKVLSDLERNMPLGSLPAFESMPANFTTDWLTVVRYLAVTVLLQGHRLCVVQNLLMTEYRQATTHGVYSVVRVKQHKTSSFFGPASIVLDYRLMSLWEKFAKIRRRIGSPHRNFFLNSCGSPSSSNFLENLDSFLATGGHVPVTHSMIRKSLETQAQVLLGGGEEEAVSAKLAMKQVESFLCHGSTVTRSHYRFKTNAVVIAEFKVVDTLVKRCISVEAAWKYRNEVLGEDLSGTTFPSMEAVVRKLHKVRPGLSDIAALSPMAYNEICEKWRNHYVGALLAGLKSAFDTQRGGQPGIKARMIVDSLGTVWDPIKLELGVKLTRGEKCPSLKLKLKRVQGRPRVKKRFSRRNPDPTYRFLF
jgi:hypothetical protein